MVVRELFKKFITEKRLQGLSDDSIMSYRNIIGIFIDYVGADLPLCDLSKDLVDKFILHCLDSHLARNTVVTYIRNAKVFLCWIYENDDLSFNPHKIKKPRAPKKKVQIYSDAEVVRIFNSISTSVEWITLRNKAIVSLMYDSGIRQGEVCRLLRKDLDFERKLFKVIGKGAKEHFVPMGNASVSFLQAYLAKCPYKDAQSVFLLRNGQPITRNAIRLFVNRLKHQTGLDISSHKFRHNFATNYCLDNLQSTGSSNVYDLSILMGHESIETTKRYEHFAHELVAVQKHQSHLDSILH